MRQFSTEAIILRRTNYGEADRILNVLTPENGKLSAIAKAVRRPKSKLAGGLELFAVCNLTILQGKSDMGVITSSRIKEFYGDILTDYDRMQTAYEVIKQINKVTETVTDREFYDLLQIALASLDNLKIEWKLTELWFRLRMLVLLGQDINLNTDMAGNKLKEEGKYWFNNQDFAFFEDTNGKYTADHIKLLRLALVKPPVILGRVRVGGVVDELVDLLRSLQTL